MAHAGAATRQVLRQELHRINRSLLGILTQTVPESPPVRFDLKGSLADLVDLLVPQARSQSVEVEMRCPTARCRCAASRTDCARRS